MLAAKMIVEDTHSEWALAAHRTVLEQDNHGIHRTSNLIRR